MVIHDLMRHFQVHADITHDLLMVVQKVIFGQVSVSQLVVIKEFSMSLMDPSDAFNEAV